MLRKRDLGICLVVAIVVLACGRGEPTQVEEGIASYYADSFHGKKTASGEKYNKRADTAAHRTLAFGTKVQVTNLDNGKSVWVWINDRGPHVQERIIDVSGSAARKLGIVETGTARVRVEVYD